MPKPRLKATVRPNPVKGKGKVGRPKASKASKEKTPSPKEGEEPDSPPGKKPSASPAREKSEDEIHTLKQDYCQRSKIEFLSMKEKGILVTCLEL
ncbi:hypothetical protein GH733_004320, partial [Mirounga leonina]